MENKKTSFWDKIDPSDMPLVLYFGAIVAGMLIYAVVFVLTGQKL